MFMTVNKQTKKKSCQALYSGYFVPTFKELKYIYKTCF